jgi:transposase
MGIRGRVSRSTLADANERRDWRIYRDFAHVLIGIARPLYVGENLDVDLESTAYALDSTTIDLCLSLFPWARFRRAKGAIKLHTLLDLRGSIPTFIHLSDGKFHDVRVLDLLMAEPGSFYVMDKAYVDFSRLFRIHQASAFFVIRAKRNFQYRRLCSSAFDSSSGLRCDQTVIVKGVKSSIKYPAPLRRISFVDPETKKRFVFLTNNFLLPAQSIPALYRARWQIELFFKWIKQHLRIKAFYGTSPNAVKTQVWIAISTYLLVAILKKRLNLDLSLHTILQILSLSVFEKVPILKVLSDESRVEQECSHHKQLNLFKL